MSTSKKVLVAGSDDESTNRLSNGLSDLGWTVFKARDAVSATAAVLRGRPDAVVLNGRLVGGGSLLTLKRIRSSVHTAMTPVIAITGPPNADTDEFRRNGAAHCATADPAAITAWIRKRLAEPEVVMEALPSIISAPERVAALNRSALLDSPPSEAYDTLTRVAARTLGVPVALVSLVDETRQFFKSQIGLPEPWASARETPLTHSFCQWVVSGHEDLIVADARENPILAVNRALHELGVIAYAGIPLTTTTGEAIGSFCAIDTAPHAWSAHDVELLRSLTQLAEACIAVGEAVDLPPQDQPSGEDEVIQRSLVMQALGAAIGTSTEILRRGDPRMGAPERQSLLDLVQWFGQQIVRLTTDAAPRPLPGAAAVLQP